MRSSAPNAARNPQVLLVDDDAELRFRLRTFLEGQFFDVTEAEDGAAARRRLEREAYDIALFDLLMPGAGGLDLLRWTRARTSMPVIILTAKDSETDVVCGLELGADDYVSKPFRSRELLARMSRLLRDRAGPPETTHAAAGDVEVDTVSRRATRSGRPLDLSALEFDLLRVLVEHSGRPMSRAALLEAAGRADVQVCERTVDVHISRLRKKLHDDPKHPRLIKTVHGLGYVLAPNPPTGV